MTVSGRHSMLRASLTLEKQGEQLSNLPNLAALMRHLKLGGGSSWMLSLTEGPHAGDGCFALKTILYQKFANDQHECL